MNYTSTKNKTISLSFEAAVKRQKKGVRCFPGSGWPLGCVPDSDPKEQSAGTLTQTQEIKGSGNMNTHTPTERKRLAVPHAAVCNSHS